MEYLYTANKNEVIISTTTYHEEGLYTVYNFDQPIHVLSGDILAITCDGHGKIIGINTTSTGTMGWKYSTDFGNYNYTDWSPHLYPEKAGIKDIDKFDYLLE